MSDNADDIDEVLEGEHEELDNSPDEKLSDEEYDQWVKENAPKIEEMIKEREQEKNENSEPDKIEINGKEKDYLELMQNRDELTKVIGDRPFGSKQRHENHKAYATGIGMLSVAIGMLIEPAFLNIVAIGVGGAGLRGLSIPFINRYFEKKDGNKVFKIIEHHTTYFAISSMAMLMVFLVAGFEIPNLEGIIGAFVTSMIGP